MTCYTSLHISILGRDMSCDALAAPDPGNCGRIQPIQLAR
jgi:hypothetical protein